MAGYAGYSMSNNAVDAYDDYKMPLSRLKQWLGIKDVSFSACEWHHTSSKYNSTDFYDARDAVKNGDLRKFSNPKPNDLQIFHRYLIKTIIIDEAGLELTPKNIEKLEALRALAKSYIRTQKEKSDKRFKENLAKKEAERQQKLKEQMEKWKKEKQTTAAPIIAFRLKCQAINRKKLAEILGTDPTDNTGIVFQVHKWFAGIDLTLEEKLALAEN